MSGSSVSKTHSGSDYSHSSHSSHRRQSRLRNNPMPNRRSRTSHHSSIHGQGLFGGQSNNSPSVYNGSITLDAVYKFGNPDGNTPDAKDDLPGFESDGFRLTNEGPPPSSSSHRSSSRHSHRSPTPDWQRIANKGFVAPDWERVSSPGSHHFLGDQPGPSGQQPRRRPGRPPKAKEEEVLKLISENMSDAGINRKTGVSKDTIRRWRDKHQLRRSQHNHAKANDDQIIKLIGKNKSDSHIHEQLGVSRDTIRRVRDENGLGRAKRGRPKASI